MLAAALGWALCAAGACVPAGCGGSGEDRAPPDQSYTVRGRIVMLPEAGKPASVLQIRHEAIEHFVDSKGKVVGMEAMTMPFPTAKGLSLAGLAVGDAVEFTFEVRWDGSPIYQVTRITELPEGTALEFESAPEPGAG